MVERSKAGARLWEKHRNKAIPGPADRLLRSLYDEYIGGDGSIKRMAERLAKLDQIEHARGNFRETGNHRWKQLKAPELEPQYDTAP
jgi:putative transcriptional regulator